MRIEAIILAAGFSSRAGVFKMSLDFDGKTMLERCVEAFYPICTRIIVVGGFQIEKIEAMLNTYNKTEIIMNEHFEKGMFSSVKKGVEAVRADLFFLTPGDYPLIHSSVCEKLIESRGDIAIPTFNGKKGHPVRISGNLKDELLKEPPENSLRDFIDRKGYTPVEVGHEGILLDVDTLEAYHRIRSKKIFDTEHISYYNKISDISGTKNI